MGEREIVALERIAAALERSNQIARARLCLDIPYKCGQPGNVCDDYWTLINAALEEREPAPAARSEET